MVSALGVSAVLNKIVSIFQNSSIRNKLVFVFVLTKALPLILLAWIAWLTSSELAGYLGNRVEEMTVSTRETLNDIGSRVTRESVVALDNKSRDSIERLTTDTANAIASFLYDRDNDILLATSLPVNETSYRRFLQNRTRTLSIHGDRELHANKNEWVVVYDIMPDEESVRAQLKDNDNNFHYRSKSADYIRRSTPLYAEMTFLNLEGQELVKVSTNDLMGSALRTIRKRQDTWLKAETYFERLKDLNPGEIDVSRVIGAYVPTHLIGPYTPSRAAEAGIDFAPEKSAYAGKENPLGQRFQGIVRWSSPVKQDGEVIGYVTLALDHAHIMEFTDHIVPTEKRYSDISDAGSGNYAFLWDYDGRNISHPRDYFIVGHDPKTGDLAVPWLSSEVYEVWQNSGLSYQEFQTTAPKYKDQSRSKKPSSELKTQGNVALDCRFLNFAPQCTGWKNLTQYGGSGSFLIFWSGLWKLSTAATVPYFTAQYGNSPRGFGWVTIGANVDEFHRPALETKVEIDQAIRESEMRLLDLNKSMLALILDNAKELLVDLSVSTLIMLALVLFIAVWLATALAGRVKQLNEGLMRFQNGDLDTRLDKLSNDEFGQLTSSFNTMADRIQGGFQRLNNEIEERRLAENKLAEAQNELEDRVESRTAELSASNDRLKDEVLKHSLTEKSRLEAERVKNDAQQRLADAVEVLPSAFALFDAEDRLVLFNAEYEKIFGTEDNALKPGDSYEDVLKHFADKLQGENRPGNMDEYLNSRMMRRGLPARNMIFQYEPGHWIEINDYPLKNGALIFVGIDVSERRRLEAQLGHSQKMEAVGQLTGGIAHDFNNILGIVMGNLELIEEAVSTDKKILLQTKAALKGVSRGAEITKKLLRFSSGRVSGTKLVLLGEFLEGMEDLIAKCLTASINFSTSVEDDLWLVDIDPSEFEDAIINLTLNARDAMPEGGSMTITMCNKSLDDSYIRSHSFGNVGEYTLISVSDTGIGMTDEIKSKIFDPFYTTKEDGKGTGLGLSMVYGFVKRSGGHIDIQSSLGEGSTFNIYLPRANTSKMEVNIDDDVVDELPEGTETILVVDDENALARVTADTLKQLGYHPLVAQDGPQALKILEEHPEIDMLFSDVVMPGGMDGYQLALKVHGEYPDLPILLTSGFTRQLEANSSNQNSFSRGLMSSLLSKPYNKRELAISIRRTLDSVSS